MGRFHSCNNAVQAWQDLALRIVWLLKLHWLIPIWGTFMSSPNIQQKHLLQVWEVQHCPAEHIHPLEHTAGFSCTEPQRGSCACIWFSPGTGNPTNFTEISISSVPNVSSGAVQTGSAQLCLDEWWAFKTHSRQGPWQAASKDVCFDFPHL